MRKVLFVLVSLMLLMPTLIGFAIDRTLGSTPWAILTGTFVGIFFATFTIVRVVGSSYERISPGGEKRGDE